jgi:hypothetical protein
LDLDSGEIALIGVKQMVPGVIETSLPASAKNFLPWSVVSRPLNRDAPTIDVTVSFHRANASPILKTFLSRIDSLDVAQ